MPGKKSRFKDLTKARIGTVSPPIGFDNPLPLLIDLGFPERVDDDDVIYDFHGNGLNRDDFHCVIEASEEELVEADIQMIVNDYAAICPRLSEGSIIMPKRQAIAFGRPPRVSTILYPLAPPAYTSSRFDSAPHRR